MMGLLIYWAPAMYKTFLLGPADLAVNKQQKNPLTHEIYILGTQTIHKHIVYLDDDKCHGESDSSLEG